MSPAMLLGGGCLQSIYRSPAEPESQRIRAAIEALPFETPKLTAVGVGYLTRDTFAERLRARYRPQQRRAPHRGRS
jgi:hypothetical protein